MHLHSFLCIEFIVVPGGLTIFSGMQNSDGIKDSEFSSIDDAVCQECFE